MYLFIIITLVLSLKCLCEGDYYKFIATNPPEAIFGKYSAAELRNMLIDCLFKLFCTFYELIFYLVLFYYIRDIFILALTILHWGIFIKELPSMTKNKGPIDEKVWHRRVVFCKVWAACEAVILSYFLYSMKKLV